ncbi:MAG TPA: tRNA pseudouridine(55) synthase TruB [Pyrinomonadaceae bacterium]|jgi:tRNA pseudouridine55 synthase
MDGVLIIDKPAGLTSHDVVARVRRTLGERRVGHTGTLDPFATGVLVLLIGRATRLAQFLAGADKEYEALVRFGFATDTGDVTGRAVAETGALQLAAERLSRLGAGEIEAALSRLRGEIEQVPPMYSAKKVQGRKLYELARRGLEVERPAVRVRIYELEALGGKDGALLSRNPEGTCDLRLRVVCSAGTYVRALAESLGESLGVGAHLAQLRRTRAGRLSLEAALTLEELEERALSGSARSSLLSLNAALSEMPSLHLTASDAERARHGVAVPVPAQEEEKYLDGQWVRMIDEAGDFVGVAVYRAEAPALHPRVILAPEK